MIYSLPLMSKRYFILCKLHNLESIKAHLKYFRKLDLNREQGLLPEILILWMQLKYVI